MLGYDYSISYKEGSQNIVVDALSRAHEHQHQLFQCTGNLQLSWSKLWNQINQSYKEDAKL